MWEGKTVFCIASGPSLTKQDCDYVKSLNVPTVAVNNAWKLATFCDVIYATDPGWWKHNGSEITVAAERWTCFENVAKTYKLNCHGPFLSAQNSGVRALQFAIDRGASRVVLLGYDCSVANGVHFDGPHAHTGNPTEASTKRWQTHFARMDKKKCEVLNCSRYSELEVFPKIKLEDIQC